MTFRDSWPVPARAAALSLVMLFVALIGVLPGAVPSAASEREQLEVTVAVRNLEPFVIADAGKMSGFTIDVVEEMAERSGWKLRYLEVASVAEQLKALSDGTADLAATAISITSERARNFDFSQPIMSGGPQILAPISAREPSTPGLKEFLQLLFSKMVLVWLVAAFVITLIPAHITWFVERRHEDPMVSRSYFPGILQSFRWTLGSMTGVADDAPRHSASRVIAVLWGFISIIFVAYYTATLTANITVGKFDAQIKSPSDLIGKKVCTVAGTTSSAVLGEFGVAFDGVRVIDDCYRGLEDGTFQAAVYDAPVLRYYANSQGRGKVELVGQVIRAEEYGIAFRNGSALRKQGDQALLSMFEDGDYYLIQSKWFGSDIEEGTGNG